METAGPEVISFKFKTFTITFIQLNLEVDHFRVILSGVNWFSQIFKVIEIGVRKLIVPINLSNQRKTSLFYPIAYSLFGNPIQGDSSSYFCHWININDTTILDLATENCNSYLKMLL